MSVPKLDVFVPSANSILNHGRHFIDDHGRVLNLRGVNVGSASKVPNKHIPIDQHASASYINRPFPLEDAPTHWARLRSWGLTFIRINVTWDALEHAGHGQYDTEYLAYLRALLKTLEGTGLVAYVSIHQDVWSRYTGGSGAPGWTLEAAGFDLSNNGQALKDTGAAFLDGVRGGRLAGERGLWPTGYQKLACATMSTLFWGGDTFAPSLKVGPKGVSIQQYLQDAFLAAYDKLVEAVGDLDTVMGFEMMNEPHPGYIGISNIDEWNYNTDLHLGEYPSPMQGMCLGAGHAVSVPVYRRSWPFPTRISGRTIANKTGASAWTADGPTGGKCPWEREGVWRWSNDKKKAVALAQDYFMQDRVGKKINWYNDFYYPFVARWEALVSKRQPKKAHMLEPLPNEFCPIWPAEHRPKNFVYAPHWYDLNALFTKQFGFMTVNVQGLSRGMFPLRALYFGMQVKDNYALQIRNIVKEARGRVGEVPIVFGECGVPMDLNHEAAFKSGDWKWQERMMDALISALESSLVNFNLWNYNPLNSDQEGDDWNAENFSWYSDENRQKMIDAAPVAEKAALAANPDTGGRLLDVVVRPYAVATAGLPLTTSYERTTHLFTHRFRDTPQLCPKQGPPAARVTEIFLPRRTYPKGEIKWTMTMNGRAYFDAEKERLFVWFDDTPELVHQGKEVHRRIDVWVRPGDDPKGSVATIGLVFILACGLFYVLNEVKKAHTGEPWVYWLI